MNKIEDMPKIGCYFGKFLPCHRGHLSTILNAATACQKLYVVISDNKDVNKKKCEEAGIKEIPLAKRVQWLSQELIDMPHIKVIALDETDIPEPPNGWDLWTKRLQEIIKEPINTFFCGELEYKEKLNKYFPNATVRLFDPDRTFFNISATKIRNNPIKYWDYILGSARPFFAKKVLIAGTESTGKTTLTKTLAKIYHTSWSEEVGRYYAERFLGGNENYFTDEDFTRIAHQQVEQDYKALRSANRICFFDTDATATQYFSKLYMGHYNKIVESYINPEKYDLVIFLKPDIEWIDDGQRLNGDQKKRFELHHTLKSMYESRGFNILEIGGNYEQRLQTVLNKIKQLLEN